MSEQRGSFKRVVALGLLAVALSCTAFAAGGKDKAKGKGNANPMVVPPNANFRGKSYSEWAAEFWKWALALPVEGHPFLDDNPEYDFAKNQTGKVWFWSAPEGSLTRHATVPTGVAIFLTIRDAEVSSLEEPPFFGATEAEQRAGANWLADHIVDVFATIDGVPVENLQDYRFDTPQFHFNAPTPWIFANTGGAGTAVGDGYFLMLHPLSKGHHTIHYGGTFHFEAGELGNDEPFDLSKDITIELDVK